ncbi:cobalamin-binding protein [Candidatus Fermentibacteria bacterium]|nr:MAG: cobalamin-binding protein [Candidatus Fermentibacteria bacterium]
MELLEQISENLQNGFDEKVAALTKDAVEKQIHPKEILQNGLIAGMNVVSKKFKNHDIFLPDVLLAARAMNSAMEVLKPLLIKEGIPIRGKVVIGSVKDDLHDIGKNLVAILLKGAGFEVIDLGNDVPAEKFISTAMEENAHVIGMSALLTTTMPVMKKVVDLAKDEGLYGRVRIIVGGAPVSKEYALEIGADAYSYDGANAVETVESFFPVNS